MAGLTTEPDSTPGVQVRGVHATCERGSHGRLTWPADHQRWPRHPRVLPESYEIADLSSGWRNESILRRPLNAIDDQDPYRSLRRLQFQTELLFQGFKECLARLLWLHFARRGTVRLRHKVNREVKPST
jgi:hypothetical protein